MSRSGVSRSFRVGLCLVFVVYTIAIAAYTRHLHYRHRHHVDATDEEVDKTNTNTAAAVAGSAANTNSPTAAVVTADGAPGSRHGDQASSGLDRTKRNHQRARVRGDEEHDATLNNGKPSPMADLLRKLRAKHGRQDPLPATKNDNGENDDPPNALDHDAAEHGDRHGDRHSLKSEATQQHQRERDVADRNGAGDGDVVPEGQGNGGVPPDQPLPKYQTHGKRPAEAETLQGYEYPTSTSEPLPPIPEAFRGATLEKQDTAAHVNPGGDERTALRERRTIDAANGWPMKWPVMWRARPRPSVPKEFTLTQRRTRPLHVRPRVEKLREENTQRGGGGDNINGLDVGRDGDDRSPASRSLASTDTWRLSRAASQCDGTMDISCLLEFYDSEFKSLHLKSNPRSMASSFESCSETYGLGLVSKLRRNTRTMCRTSPSDHPNESSNGRSLSGGVGRRISEVSTPAFTDQSPSSQLQCMQTRAHRSHGTDLSVCTATNATVSLRNIRDGDFPWLAFQKGAFDLRCDVPGEAQSRWHFMHCQADWMDLGFSTPNRRGQSFGDGGHRRSIRGPLWRFDTRYDNWNPLVANGDTNTNPSANDGQNQRQGRGHHTVDGLRFLDQQDSTHAHPAERATKPRSSKTDQTTTVFATRSGDYSPFAVAHDWVNIVILLASSNTRRDETEVVIMDRMTVGFYMPMWQGLFSPMRPLVWLPDLRESGAFSTASTLKQNINDASTRQKTNADDHTAIHNPTNGRAAASAKGNGRPFNGQSVNDAALNFAETPMLFDRMLFNIPARLSPLYNEDDCGHSPLVRLTSDLILYEAGAGDVHPPLDRFVVTVIIRKNYATGHKIGRRLGNSEALVDALRSSLTAKTGSASNRPTNQVDGDAEGTGKMAMTRRPVVVNALDYADLDFDQQLAVSRSSDVLVGMHGAGLIQAMFLPEHAGVFEFFCPDRPASNTRYQHLSRRLGLRYGDFSIDRDDNVVDIGRAVPRIQALVDTVAAAKS